MRMTATYSPDDNKLRLYAETRLDAETYARVKSAGFRWAPKQELFVAPAWTPDREDLLIDLCGGIDDEDASLTDRAEERAERFEEYGSRREADAERAYAAVERIADGIPMGQPILVGHHSERHARRDTARIENGMRHAVKMWETSRYWEDRAKGALRHAKYKELPGVRARRIKTIESERRKSVRTIEHERKSIEIWEGLETSSAFRKKDGGEVSFLDRAVFIAGNTRHADWHAYSDLREGKATPEQVRARIIENAHRIIACNERWLAHYDNRLSYERAMLDESGYTPPPKPKTSAALPLLNYSGTVSYRNPYSGEIVTSEAVPITKAELAQINADYKGTRVSACGTHRIRTALHVPGQGRMSLCVVYVSDSKQHARPSADAVQAKAAEEREAAERAADAKRERSFSAIVAREAARDPEQEAKDAQFRELKEAIRSGNVPRVEVVRATGFYPTPPELAARVAQLADVQPGARVLEPSAGSGNLIAALPNIRPDGEMVAVELNSKLAQALQPHADTVHCADFLDLTPDDLGTFDRVLMNPPFDDGADVRHIEHARKFLKPGGRLVAICANGPRQNAKLRPIVEESGGTWEDLPPDSFRSSGTSVNVALLSLEAPPNSVS